MTGEGLGAVLILGLLVGLDNLQVGAGLGLVEMSRRRRWDRCQPSAAANMASTIAAQRTPFSSPNTGNTMKPPANAPTMAPTVLHAYA